ncbi:hypothetical protein P3T22_006686, partial [Paraburkholderia sp. GAS348]
MPFKRRLVAASAISLAVIAGVGAMYHTYGGAPVTEAAAAAAPPAADVDVATV